MDMSDTVIRAGFEKAPERKLYSSPRLVEYGHVEKLTRSGGATSPDGRVTNQLH